MRNEFEVAFNEIAELRALPREVVLDALQTALVSAYRRDASASSAQRVEAEIDPTTGRARIFVEKEVVEDVFNDHTEVELEKARFFDPEADLGDMVMVQIEGSTKKFGRIAAQTAKQVILQKIREAERNSLYEEFSEREGDLLTGTVQSINPAVVTLSLGRAEAILPRAQQIPGERYKPHEKLRTYVLEVKRTNRGPNIVVSRAHRGMLRRLLEYEVPEIYNAQVEIKSIAREAGYRSKVAVAALQDGIDPVGACVGMRGVRIQNIVKELHDEKIDVIEWNADQEIFIGKALSPARVTGVFLDDDPNTGRTAVVLVPDDQLSLAIGREGQNARLAAKLTGWRIDIKSVTEAVTEALGNADSPILAELMEEQAEIVEEVRLIIEKKEANRTVMPEEYRVMGQFAELIERRLLAAREDARRQRREEINAVKSTLPEAAFNIPLDYLDVADEIIQALTPLGSVGDVMLYFLVDENRVNRLLEGLEGDIVTQLEVALDTLMIPENLEAAVATLEAEAAAEDPEVDDTEDEEVVAEAEPEEIQEVIAEDQLEPALDVFGDEPVSEEPEPVIVSEPRAREKRSVMPEDDEVEYFEPDEELELDLLGGGKSQQKKKLERQQRRQLVFDEEAGRTVVKRRRKGGRKRGEWDEEEYDL